MAAASSRSSPACFDLKEAMLPLMAVVLKSTDLAALGDELAQQLADAPALFNHDPVIVDLSAVNDAGPIDFAALARLLRSHRMVPVGVRGGSAAQAEAAASAGLPEAGSAPAPQPRTVVQEVVREVEVLREVPVAAPILVVDKPLRSGQQVYAKGGDLVVLAVVSYGAEVLADGNIHVYAPLRGRAVAGAKGNAGARIFTTCLEPELISIAGTYRTSDTPLADDVRGKPAQVRLVDDKLVAEPLTLS